jgi:class 3 adenylate cyclase
MARLVVQARRAATVLFADLEASGELSRRLPSSRYFHVIRALTTQFDDTVAAECGIVGKHVGDGMTAFFLTDDLGMASHAAAAAIRTAREMHLVACIGDPT